MEKIYLWKDKSIKTRTDRPSIVPFLLDGSEKRPAILLIPGGGYGIVCESTEGTPTAKRFNEMGYNVFVLDYRTAPDRYPAPQLDAMRAMKMIRANAEKFNIDPDHIISCGFSAGGHLAGSLGVICNDLDASDGDECDNFSHIPNAMILIYGVLAFEEWSHIGSMENLVGRENMQDAYKYSLPRYVNENTPPTFLIHTICDQWVPYRNSTEFADAMAKNKRPCELALYYWGDHGMLLGNDTLDIRNWMKSADEFLRSLNLEKNDPEFRTRYTHAYQAGTVLK